MSTTAHHQNLLAIENLVLNPLQQFEALGPHALQKIRQWLQTEHSLLFQEAHP